MLDAEQVISLNALDRCDRCGAQAYVKASRFDIDEALLFCGHHGKMHQVALRADGWFIEADTQYEELGTAAKVNI